MCYLPVCKWLFRYKNWFRIPGFLFISHIHICSSVHSWAPPHPCENTKAKLPLLTLLLCPFLKQPYISILLCLLTNDNERYDLLFCISAQSLLTSPYVDSNLCYSLYRTCLFFSLIAVFFLLFLKYVRNWWYIMYDTLSLLVGVYITKKRKFRIELLDPGWSSWIIIMFWKYFF